MHEEYKGEHFQRVSLVQALQELHKRNVSDQQISDRINEAIRNPRNEGRFGRRAISRATIQRYRTTSNDLMGAREDQVKAIYNILAQDREFRSTLSIGYRSIYTSHVVGPLMYNFLHWLRNPKNAIDVLDLMSFTGVYELYQPLSSSIEDDRYAILPAQFEAWGTTCHMATSPTEFGFPRQAGEFEIQYASLIPCGTNVLMLSQQREPHVFRLYAIHDMVPYPGTDQPIEQFAGNVLTVTGKGPHASRPFFAERVLEATESAQIMSRRDLPLRVRRKLAAAERAAG